MKEDDKIRRNRRKSKRGREKGKNKKRKKGERSRVTFSVRSALTNSTTEFSVLSAPRLYNATLGIFAELRSTVRGVKFYSESSQR
jgi:hypothetical protein